MKVDPYLRAVTWPQPACRMCARITVRGAPCDRHCDFESICTVQSLREFLAIARAVEKLAAAPPVNAQSERSRAAWASWRERNGRPRKVGAD